MLIPKSLGPGRFGDRPSYNLGVDAPLLLDIPEEITTDRLILRAPRNGDGAGLYESISASREALELWIPFVHNSLSEEICETEMRRARARFILREDLRFHLFLRSDDRPVGGTGLHRIDWAVPKFEIGYWVDTRFAGQGLATEAARAMTELAFGKLGAKRVEIRCDSLNVASAAIPPKLGYELEATLRKSSLALCEPHEPRDMLLFAQTC